MHSVFFLFIILVALVLQATALDFIVIRGVKPDLVLIMVILNGFLRGTREGAFLGFVGGALQDLVTGGYFGTNTLAKLAAGYLAGLGEGRLYRDNRVIATGLTWFCTIGAQVVYYILLVFINVHVPVVTAFVDIIIPTAFYNALVVFLIYGFYYRSRLSDAPGGDL